MSVHSNIHFCLIGSPAPKIESGAHPTLTDTIDVTMRIGETAVTISGSTDAVCTALWGLLSAALRVRPLTAADDAARVAP